MCGPHFWLELFFAEMEKPGKEGSGLEAKARSDLLSGKHREAGLGEANPGQGVQFRADPASPVRDSDEGDLGG